MRSRRSHSAAPHIPAVRPGEPVWAIAADARDQHLIAANVRGAFEDRAHARIGRKRFALLDAKIGEHARHRSEFFDGRLLLGGGPARARVGPWHRAAFTTP
jgi:hypothetical protein